MSTVICALLLVAAVASALGVVWTRHESRVLFVQLTQLQNQRDDLNIEYGRLELEQATYAEPRRIDDEARQKLGMVDPRPQDIRLLR
ncbi:MAG: cell division protein FtsL [Rhodanobacter sp.]|uniref:Cell division protein FtsL n=2 Tax=unclassified Rhodanobacter TaxID=2621553 RepID=A0AB74V0P8_9GAMM|nr:cell division protein FtsL [Rhodanobacter sp.]MBN8948312.1 cell division protein FtsL [Rhodanobacter sp.]MBZ0134704.1 cell division protein FtsL [Rhodanobacter sp.]ODT96237.1 MAG: cell division protein FtsL [Rhodanobacter sp. SCN 67-45]OJW37180.1 MAG: cell division protein FtsL [Rhodanobacter sp. 67-28]